MPGKKYKSIGIREKLYERIEEEKREGESTSNYIDRVIGTAKENKEGKNEGLNLEQIKNAVKEVLNERESKGKIIRKDTGIGLIKEDLRGLTKEDLKQALLGLENDIDMKIRDLLNEVMNKL